MVVWVLIAYVAVMVFGWEGFVGLLVLNCLCWIVRIEIAVDSGFRWVNPWDLCLGLCFDLGLV